jgi:hypothetical protein
MSRVFAYCRVSTKEQTTENQVHAAGCARDKRVAPHPPFTSAPFLTPVGCSSKS